MKDHRLLPGISIKRPKRPSIIIILLLIGIVLFLVSIWGLFSRAIKRRQPSLPSPPAAAAPPVYGSRALDVTDTWFGMAEVGPDSTPSAWQATNPSVLLMAYKGWMGVFSAASAQGHVLGTLLDFDASAVRRLVSLIDSTPSLRVVVIHGIPPGSLLFARALKEKVPRVRILVVYHGTASAPFHETESALVDNLIETARSGAIDAVGTVKVGFASTFSLLGVASVFTVPNFLSVSSVLPTGKYSDTDGLVHVGILTSSGAFHKNVATQVVAACAIPGIVVHVTFRPHISYLHNCHLVETGLLSHGRFLVEVSRMDALLYVSLTECYPMLVLEAITLGIPVVVSRTHHILETDAVLNSALVVNEADSPENIRVVLEGAIARRTELRPRLLALAICLRRKAEFEWGNVLGLSKSESRRLQLIEYADRRVAGAVSLPAACTAVTGNKAASELFPVVVDTLSAPLLRIAFVTYELTPGVPGGAGVLISSLAEELLMRGHSVTILAHMPATALSEWVTYMTARGWKVGVGAQLTVYNVAELASEATLVLSACSPRNIFLRRAGVFAIAAQAAYNADPFDAIEIFEYAGAAFELLRRLHEWQYAQASGTTAAAPYLPPHVPILVRLHGSMQLIHQAEGVEPPDGRPEPCTDSNSERRAWPLMYLMERYSMSAAHALLPQSAAMQRIYVDAYGLDDHRMVLAPPPMPRLLADLVAAASVPVSRPSFDSNQLRLLVYGRVARMKGAETVASAASVIQKSLPAGMILHLAFVGIDWECSVHQRSTSECVRALLPENVVVSFQPPVERPALAKLAATMHGAIVASDFETYGLAAHELAAVGLPLIISDIAAFKEFFTERNAYVFRAGDINSLARAALLLADDVSRGSTRIAQIDYADPIMPYLRVMSVVRATPGGLAQPHADMRLVESSIAALEGPCWPTAACREEGLRMKTEQ